MRLVSDSDSRTNPFARSFAGRLGDAARIPEDPRRSRMGSSVDFGIETAAEREVLDPKPLRRFPTLERR